MVNIAVEGSLSSNLLASVISVESKWSRTLPTSIGVPLEVHNHELKGRAVSVAMMLSSYIQWPRCKYKVGGALDFTRVRELSREN